MPAVWTQYRLLRRRRMGGGTVVPQASYLMLDFQPRSWVRERCLRKELTHGA